MRLLRTPPRAGFAGIALLLFSFCIAPTALAQNGTIAGVVVDSETGETLIGVNVVVDELGAGAATGLDGDFRIPGVPAGSYTVVFSYLGYTSQRVTGVDVAAGETTNLDIALAEEALELEGGGEVVVEATAIRNNEAALLRARARAAAVSDAISAENISRSGASNAADAMQKVPGASVVGGKYLVVRGLSDRYLNTQLNGATLPSADPERQSAPLDLFPSSLLENIVTLKSFTPDKPGTFTGGGVNISTRSFPETFTARFSVSSGLNTAVEPGSDYLLYSGGSLGLFGSPGGELGLPSIVDGLSPTDISSAPTEQRAAITNAFGTTFAPAPESVPADASFNASIGNQFDVAGRPFGFLLGANWSSSTDGYSSGVNRDFSGTASGFDEAFDLDTQVGERAVDFGGLANLNYRLTDRNEIGLNVLYNRSATSEAVLQQGFNESVREAGNVYQGRSLRYIENALFTSQFSGKHALSDDGLRVEWNGAYSRTTLDEPDFRIFQNEFNAEDSGDVDYLIATSAYDSPSRTFRSLTEDGVNGALDVEIPVGEMGGRAIQVKVGGAADVRSRAFDERTFVYPINFNIRVLNEYGGDPNALIANAVEEGLLIDEQTDLRADYDGMQQVYAGYGMVDLALTERLRFVGGARYEYTDLSVSSPNGAFADGGYTAGGLGEALLPAASFVYAVTDDMNFRAAYGKTLARPSFREIAPRAVFSLAERYTINGNPDLAQTQVHNVDVRWEWFTGPGQILAASGFYKRFIDPIELTFLAGNNQFEPNNLGDADLLGIELEARRRLGFLPGALGNLQVGGNLSLVQAEVQLTERELDVRRDESGDTRPLEGQSPYVLNLSLGYADLERGTTVDLFYNLFGRRLFAVSQGPLPDIYEDSRPTLDLTASQELWRGLSAKVSAKNLLGSDYELVYYADDLDDDLVRRSYDLGRSFSFGVSYSF